MTFKKSAVGYLHRLVVPVSRITAQSRRAGGKSDTETEQTKK